jgi:hypothetical protein
MKHALPTFLTAFALSATLSMAAAAADAGPAASPDPATDPKDRGPVFVEGTDILYLESFPVQVHLAVSGSVPTPCHEPEWEVDTTDEAIAVTLWSVAPQDAVCASVLAPFEVSIPLGDFERADVPVVLNGEVVGQVVVGVPDEASDDGLVGAGWSFGMCAGFCRADLVITGDDLVLRGSDRSGGQVLFENAGRLTPAGRDALDAAVSALSDTRLEPRYGCPDCADGGASYLVLVRDGEMTRHDMEHGAPPPELGELDDLANQLIDALQTCEPDALVTVADDCEAWRG